MKNRNVNQVMVRKLFDTDVDIADYDRIHSQSAPHRQTKAKFIKFTWIDISGKTKDDPDMQNLFIRDAQSDRSEGIQNLKISTSRGWDNSFFPPCYGTDGQFRDGRSRVTCAIDRGEKWMIVALYEYQNSLKPMTNYLANSILANAEHAPAELSKMKDYVEAAVALILINELENDRTAITNFLYNDCQIEKRFPGNIGGHITKITDQIVERAKEGLNGATILRKEDKDWIDWIEKSISKNAIYWKNEYGISSMDDVAFYKTGRGAAERILTRHILPNASKGVVTNIILYANGTRDEMIKDHVAFEEALQELYEYTYKWINHEIRGIELKHNVNSPMWKIVGVIPQFVNDDLHEVSFKKGHLVSMNQIRKHHKMNNILPFVA